MDDQTILRVLLADLVETAQAQEMLAEIGRESPEKIQKLVADIGGWGHFYELPASHLIAVFLFIAGLEDRLTAARALDDPACAFFDQMASDPEADADLLDALSEEDRAILIGVTFAILGNQNARRMYNRWLSDLVADAGKGDDEALFNAVAVDRVALQSRPIARRIGEAQITGDGSFMDRLAKPITRTRTRPRRPKPEYDETRYLIDLVNKLSGGERVPHADLYRMLVEELEVYPSDGNDPMAGLAKLIQKRNKTPGSAKPIRLPSPETSNAINITAVFNSNGRHEHGRSTCFRAGSRRDAAVRGRGLCPRQVTAGARRRACGVGCAA